MAERGAGAAGPSGTGGTPRDAVYIFSLLFAANCMVNFDCGGAAAVLDMLTWGCPPDQAPAGAEATYKGDTRYPCFDQTWKGYLGAAPYVGLIFSCPLVDYSLTNCKAKPVLLGFLMLNATATLVLSFMIGRQELVMCKFVIGLTQGCIAIYAPVWVSAFAPHRHKALFLGLMQSAAAIGTLVGYSVCGFLVSGGVYFQWGFRIQAAVLVGVNGLLWCVKGSRYDTHGAQPEAGPHRRGSLLDALPEAGASLVSLAVDVSGRRRSTAPTFLSAMSGRTTLVRPPPREAAAADSADGDEAGGRCTTGQLFREPMYMASLFVLTGLYFVVNVIQFWASEYFTTVFLRDKAEVTSVFCGVSATAPILGVVVGSSITDSLGGLGTHKQVAKICRVLCVWGLCAAAAGVCAGAVEPHARQEGASVRFYLVVSAVWVLLFFGGALVPSVSVINLEAVPARVRPAASSFTMMVYTLFGFTPGVLLPSVLSDRYNLRVAMQVSLSCSPFGVAGLLVCTCIAARRAGRGARKGPPLEPPVLEASNLEVEMASPR